MELHFKDYEFGEPKYSELECRTRDLTFGRPLYVEVELRIKETGEIQSQRVYMGDFPTMTDQGTFIINGAERVVVSQLVRSPGVYYTGTEDPATGRLLYSAKVIPNRGAWLEFETGASTSCTSRSTASGSSRRPNAARRRLRDQTRPSPRSTRASTQGRRPTSRPPWRRTPRTRARRR
jgi:DNA-directed RNA polymerase beta subunit